LNVVKNSIEARLQGGGVIEFQFDAAERCLTVADDGRGMTPNELEGLFSPFRTTKEGGSGLGLYLARRMAADTNCKLSIDSVFGEGTIVSLVFPPKPPTTPHPA
jgi:signal transduction histidine kinase